MAPRTTLDGSFWTPWCSWRIKGSERWILTDSENPPVNPFFARKAPAQASKDDNASPGGPTGRSKINWLVGESWYPRPPNSNNSDWVQEKKVSVKVKHVIYHRVKSTLNHDLQVRGWQIERQKFLSPQKSICHATQPTFSTLSCRANKVTSSSHQGPNCEGSKERTTLTYHGWSTPQPRIPSHHPGDRQLNLEKCHCYWVGGRSKPKQPNS